MKPASILRHRWVRRLWWTLFTLFTLYILLAQWINWRGARELHAAIEDFEKAGETLDFRALVPDPPADDQNFCAIPLLKDLADEEKGKAGRERLDRLVVNEDRSGSWPSLGNAALLGQSTDLVTWARYLADDDSISAEDAAVRILERLAPDADLAQTLVDALDRPDAAWTPSWKTRALPDNLIEVELPHYQGIMNLSRTLALLTLAEIRLEHTDRAHQLLLAQLRLAQASIKGPFLIGLLVGAAQLQLATPCVWELAHARLGSRDQFRTLTNELSQIDPRTALLQAYRTETTAGVNAMMYVKSNAGLRAPSVYFNGTQSDSWLVELVCSLSFWPGLLDSNAATLIRQEHAHLIQPLRDGEAAFNDSILAMEAEISQKARLFRPDRFIAHLILPTLASLGSRIECAQGSLQLAIESCRLEAHFAEKGAYPDQISDSGNGSNYERTSSRYRLWLPGLDGEDDGGKRVLKEVHPNRTRFHDKDYQGDWVWDFPEER